MKSIQLCCNVRARCVLFLLGLLLIGNACQAAPPNVLLISIDDLNDWIGPLQGHPQVKTPHLDRLAARGTTFTNAHCQAPLCNPSRTSVLTGLRPTTTGVYALSPWFRTSPEFRDLATLPQWFKHHGYRTLTGGKVFHDSYPPAAQRADGTEVDVWGVHGGFQPRPMKKFVDTPTPTPLMDWGVYPERDEETFDWDVTEWARSQLQSPSREPWLLCVGLRHPHVPCYAPQRWFDLYPDESLVMPPVRDDDRADTPEFSWYLHWKLPEPRLSWLRRSNQWRPLVRSYLASVSFADMLVGRLLDSLDASGQADNTLVVLWSDHGWHLGEKGVTGKNTLWERSTRVPLIFAGPGVTKGQRCSQPAELLDLYPTLLALCALPTNDRNEGLSLQPQLVEATTKRARPALTTHNPGNHGLRSDRWRYIRYADNSEELYDLRDDPNEWTNRAAEPQLADVKRDLAQWLPRREAAHLPGSKARDLIYRDGVAIWEGQPIRASEKEE